MEGLSVILPVRHPEPYLDFLRKQISNTLKSAKIKHEVLTQEEPGLTTAVVEGVKKSRFDHIAVMDADGSHNPVYLVSMYKLMNNYDVVVGFKFIDENPCYRRLVSLMFRMIAKLVLKLNVIDPMSGFVMGQRRLFEMIKPSSDQKFILQILTLKPNIKEIPIKFLKRKMGKSHITPLTGFRIFKAIFEIRMKSRI
jgi:dolichol-phosphate mannosyltransferase